MVHGPLGPPSVRSRTRSGPTKLSRSRPNTWPEPHFLVSGRELALKSNSNPFLLVNDEREVGRRTEEKREFGAKLLGEKPGLHSSEELSCVCALRSLVCTVVARGRFELPSTGFSLGHEVQSPSLAG